jgi:carbamate kinase
MRVVVALGGNALLRRGEPMTASNQRENVRVAAAALAPVAREHELVISHGNGPQVGLLALQGSAYTAVDTYPLDVLDAQTQGQIGYMIEQELGNELPQDKPLATLLTMIEVDPADPAFQDPTKFIGPQYSKEDADRLAGEKGWAVKPDGDMYRRVVASPRPKRIFELRPVRTLLEQGCVVLCAGGGGIPVMHTSDQVAAGQKLVGVEAVIDKDFASALLASDLEADALLIATDVDAVYHGWGTPEKRAIRRASPDAIKGSEFAAGSMGPKVRAACEFASRPGRFAAVGTLADVERMLQQTAGTIFSSDAEGIEYATPVRSTTGAA